MKRYWFLWCLCLGALLWTAQAQEEAGAAVETPRYTYQRADGNRWVAGSGTFPDEVQLVEFQLEATPLWLIAAQAQGRPQLYAMQANQQLATLCWAADEAACAAPNVTDYSAAFATAAEAAAFMVLEGETSAPQFSFNNPLNHPVPFGRGTDYWLSISAEGALVLRDAENRVLDVFARQIAPDSRIVISEDGLIALYAAATNQRYVHGIMGDDVEPTELWVFRIVAGRLEEVAQAALTGDAVFEGIAPFWADVDGDGRADLVTTVSDGQSGARLRVYLQRETGLESVDGSAIGRAYRWRHQLAFAPFSPDGAMELVDVLTPHIGGVVEWFRYEDGALVRVAALEGYTSHVIYSRNMDMALAGDFNGDGLPELVLPNQERTTLNGLQRTEGGAAVVWSLPLDGRLSSNVTALPLASGGLLLAAGLEDGRVRVWLPADGADS